MRVDKTSSSIVANARRVLNWLVVRGAVSSITPVARAGLVAAATRGRKGGRKPVVTAEKLERARTIIAKGLTVRAAAVRLKVGKTVLYDALRG